MKDDHYDLMSLDVVNGVAAKTFIPIMAKTVVVINGSGGVGKDTLCDIIATKYKCQNESSIVPIKEIATKYGGWEGQKDAKSRKFLSDLKLLFSDYNDLPFNYLMDKVKEFSEDSDTKILFVHIREPEEIRKFVKAVEARKIRVRSLLITRDTGEPEWGNMADDNVSKYNYDFYYHNCVPLNVLAINFINFFDSTIIRD